jgi:NADH-quinone oxidoreductase subunit E
MEIPADLEKKVEEAISHYPVSKRSASLPLLHLFQEHFGYISEEAITWIAARLELEPIHILELVTFYPMFRREPAGKHHIRVCRTLSCAMAGSYELKAALCKAAGIDLEAHAHEAHHGAGPHILTSPDGKFSVEFVECLASCGSAPVCMVNDDFYENVDGAAAERILKNYA